MTVDETFSENVRAEIARQQRTAADVARAIGADPRLFRKRTRSEVGWSLADADAVAQQLGLDVATLLQPTANR